MLTSPAKVSLTIKVLWVVLVAGRAVYTCVHVSTADSRFAHKICLQPGTLTKYHLESDGPGQSRAVGHHTTALPTLVDREYGP